MNMNLHAASALLFTSLAGAGTGEGALVTEDPNPSLLSINLSEDVTVKIFGRLYIDWGWFTGDSATYNTEGDGMPGNPLRLSDGTEFRTARIGAGGTLYDKVEYKVEYDIATGEAEAKDVYIAVDDTPAGTLKVGHFKEPFSLEQLTSSRFITFMERSVADSFTPGRNSGIQLGDHNQVGTFTWAAGVFRTTDDQAHAVGDAEYSYTGRVTFTPWNEDEGASLLHLGAALSYRMDSEVRFRARPEAHLLNRPADTGTLAADDTTLAGLESAWVQGPFSAQAEYQLASVSAPSGAPDGDYSGFYGYLSWFLTGEHRAYKTSSGAFDRVKPMENFGAGTGAIELALRYSMIDLDDGPSTDQMNDVTAGVNWYLNPNTRVMLNFVHSEFEDNAGINDYANLLLLRFQVDF